MNKIYTEKIKNKINNYIQLKKDIDDKIKLTIYEYIIIQLLNERDNNNINIINNNYNCNSNNKNNNKKNHTTANNTTSSTEASNRINRMKRKSTQSSESQDAATSNEHNTDDDTDENEYADMDTNGEETTTSDNNNDTIIHVQKKRRRKKKKEISSRECKVRRLDKKEQINKLMNEHKITNLEQLDNLETDDIINFTKLYERGPKSELIKRCFSILDYRKKNQNKQSGNNNSDANSESKSPEKQTASDQAKKVEAVHQRNKIPNNNQHIKHISSSQQQHIEHINNKQHITRNNNMAREHPILYAHIFTGQKLAEYINTDDSIKREEINIEINRMNLKQIKSIFITKNDAGEMFLKLVTVCSKEDQYLNSNFVDFFGGINHEANSVETNWKMICFGFSPNYDERTQKEQEYLKSKGIIKIHRKSIDEKNRGTSMMIEVDNPTNFLKLYSEKMILGNTLCNCEPVFKHPQLCKKCLNYGHYESECVAEETLCYICGDEHHPNNCENEEYCEQCANEKTNTNHTMLDENRCRVYVKEFYKLNKVYVDTINNEMVKKVKNYTFIVPENRILRGLNKKKNHSTVDSLTQDKLNKQEAIISTHDKEINILKTQMKDLIQWQGNVNTELTGIRKHLETQVQITSGLSNEIRNVNSGFSDLKSIILEDIAKRNRNQTKGQQKTTTPSNSNGNDQPFESNE